MARIPCLWASVLAAALGTAGPARAHFQQLLPSADIVADDGDHTVTLSALFTHPMERGPTMDMGRPVRFGVVAAGERTDLAPALAPWTVDGKAAWRATYKIPAPGDYVFFLEPARYFEPAERKWLIHYTKVVVDFGAGDGWDAPAGLPVEIEPLTRPYGLWTGSLFRGVVRRDGKPLPGASIEIEWVNDGSVKAPSDPFVTQVIKTDAAGTFAATLPRAGWWGFNALAEGAPAAGPDGAPARTELGGTLWVKATDMK